MTPATASVGLVDGFGAIVAPPSVGVDGPSTGFLPPRAPFPARPAADRAPAGRPRPERPREDRGVVGRLVPPAEARPEAPPARADAADPTPAPTSPVPSPDCAADAGIPLEHEPFDPTWARGMVEQVLGPIIDDWFRARVVGQHRIPTAGPCVLAANHSGNAFPYDGIALDALLWRDDDYAPERKLRTVYEHQLSRHWWLRPFGLNDFWRRAGGVDMTFDNFDRLLARGDRVLYFPEGVPGIGKGFHHRYELQPFKTSFLLLAARHRVPVVPVHIVNGEWINPFGYTLRPVDWLAQRTVRLPYLPLPVSLLVAAFPWMLWMAFPARLTYVVGEPLDVEGALRAEGVTDLDRPDRAALQRAAERLRVAQQRGLDAAVAEHGDRPFDAPSLRTTLALGRWSRMLPVCWPVSFHRHVRDAHRAPARSPVHAVARDLDLAGFYLPFVGWPLLALARRLRRPPYGLGGLPAARRRAMAGEFTWRLAERPLPPRTPAAAERMTAASVAAPPPMVERRELAVRAGGRRRPGVRG